MLLYILLLSYTFRYMYRCFQLVAPNSHVYAVYGMSEASGICLANTYMVPNSCGQIIECYKIRVSKIELTILKLNLFKETQLIMFPKIINLFTNALHLLLKNYLTPFIALRSNLFLFIII